MSRNNFFPRFEYHMFYVLYPSVTCLSPGITLQMNASEEKMLDISDVTFTASLKCLLYKHLGESLLLATPLYYSKNGFA
jgi:hypothetical protein